MRRWLVAIPSVPARAEHLARTRRQWELQGARVVVRVQEGPCSPAGHRANSRAVLEAALAADSTIALVVFCEDDVDVDPRCADWLDTQIATDAVIALYVPHPRFWGRWARGVTRETWPPRVGAVRNSAAWWGSQCVAIPGALARALVAYQDWDVLGGTGGFDIVLRELCRRAGWRILATAPTLADHRGIPSVTSRRYRRHRSPCPTVLVGAALEP